MMPAMTKQGGVCQSAPDVCKVPSPGGPIPTPFVNVGTVAQSQKTAAEVKFCNKEVVTKKSEVPRSLGDEPGTLGGIVSNVNMDKVQNRKCSGVVRATGHAVAYLSGMTAHNGTNANVPLGTHIAPSQTKVTVGIG